MLTKSNFDRQLANISPGLPERTSFDFKGVYVYYSMKLHPLYGFTWEYETIGGHNKWFGSDDEDV